MPCYEAPTLALLGIMNFSVVEKFLGILFCIFQLKEENTSMFISVPKRVQKPQALRDLGGSG